MATRLLPAVVLSLAEFWERFRLNQYKVAGRRSSVRLHILFTWPYFCFMLKKNMNQNNELSCFGNQFSSFTLGIRSMWTNRSRPTHPYWGEAVTHPPPPLSTTKISVPLIIRYLCAACATVQTALSDCPGDVTGCGGNPPWLCTNGRRGDFVKKTILQCGFPAGLGHGTRVNSAYSHRPSLAFLFQFHFKARRLTVQ